MGLIVIIYMLGIGYFVEPLIGLIGAFAGCIISTRFMQYFVVKAFPKYKDELAVELVETPQGDGDEQSSDEQKSLFTRILNSLLDGGRMGVDVGVSIIPGVLIISTLVMMLTFGPDAAKGFTGAAYQGIELLPKLAEQASGFFGALFGFSDPHQIAFPITALGAVGAALGLVPNFAAHGWIDGNAVAVFTAIGMCWSGFLSTHTAMLDSIGYRELTSKAIISHTIGGIGAALVAHWIFLLWTLVM